MIRLVADRKKLININPLVIYFVLDKEQCDEYKDDILSLNRYKDFTRGIFKYEVLTKGEKEHSVLPHDISSQFSNCNLFVRLIDSADGAFRYLFANIDLCADSISVEESIIDCAVRVCNENITTLKTLSIGADAQIDKAINIFNKALALKRTTGAVWRSDYAVWGSSEGLLENEDINIWDDESRALGRSLPSEFMLGYGMSYKAKRAIELMRSEFDENDVQDILVEILSMYGQAPDVESSHDIASGAVNDNYADSLKLEHYQRFEPQHRPQLKIEIKKVSTTIYNKVSRRYGVEIEVDGIKRPIYFKSNDRTMLYITSLLRHKIGRPLYLYELYNNSYVGGKQIRESIKPWLKSIYNTICTNTSKSFDSWYEGLQAQKGKPMHQGKSQINTTIKSELTDMRSAIYYCSLNTIKDDTENSYYSLNCSADEIVLDNDMQQLLESYTNSKSQRVH